MSVSALETVTNIDSTPKKAVEVLHVDDDVLFLETVQHCLKLYGNYNVKVARSVAEAMKKIKREKVDVIVADYHMAGKDGLEFLKELRERANMIPFILLTGRSKEDVAIKALNLGAFRYLNKHDPPEVIYSELASSIQQAFEQRQKRDLLMENLQKFMALFSENPEAVAFCDKQFHVVDINPSFIALFGYSPAEVKGKDLSELIVPENLKEEIKSIRLRLQKGHVECNTTRKKKDGSQTAVSLSEAPLVVNGNVIGYVMAYRDISDLVFANEELNRMFEEQNKMLGMTTLLNEKLSVTGSLTRHDVRNKLAAITGYSYIAKKRLVGNDEVRNYLLQIEEVVKNIVRILDFAKTYEMLGNQERVPVKVGKLVNDAASLFADLKGVTVVNECDGFEVLADSLLMELFHNMIDNSLKYGEKITQIRIYTQKGNDGIRELIYEDNGVGIDPNMKSNLFQKGFGKGTGYGLYLIKRICEMYGWSIQENGKPGKGVRFVIKMPESHVTHNINKKQS